MFFRHSTPLNFEPRVLNVNISEKHFGKFFASFNFSIVLLAAQVNREIESDIIVSGRRDQVTSHVYSRNKGYICVKMMARLRVFAFVGSFFLSSVLKIDKKCANSTQRSQQPNS